MALLSGDVDRRLVDLGPRILGDSRPQQHGASVRVPVFRSLSGKFSSMLPCSLLRTVHNQIEKVA